MHCNVHDGHRSSSVARAWLLRSGGGCVGVVLKLRIGRDVMPKHDSVAQQDVVYAAPDRGEAPCKNGGLSGCTGTRVLHMLWGWLWEPSMANGGASIENRSETTCLLIMRRQSTTEPGCMEPPRLCSDAYTGARPRQRSSVHFHISRYSYGLLRTQMRDAMTLPDLSATRTLHCISAVRIDGKHRRGSDAVMTSNDAVNEGVLNASCSNGRTDAHLHTW